MIKSKVSQDFYLTHFTWIYDKRKPDYTAVIYVQCVTRRIVLTVILLIYILLQ